VPQDTDQEVKSSEYTLKLVLSTFQKHQKYYFDFKTSFI